MRALLIGVGQAGGKLAHALSSFDANAGFGAVLDSVAVNTARADLDPLPFDSVLVGASRVNGQGVGGDNELGSTVMEEDVGKVLSALDGKLTSRAEAIVVVAGLGGGTGSGGAPVLVRELSRVYDVPVYALGVLPGRDEGAMYHVNAARSLKTLVSQADSTLLVDNDAWRSSGESVEAGYESINQAVAQRIGLLLASGEAVDGVGESVVDASEVINTLRGGGIAAVGYASAEAAPDAAENISVVTSLTRQAVRSGMSLQDASTAESALLVVAGRPEAIPRKGTERARKWLEEETDSMEVRGGDFPLDSDRLAVLVVLSGLERSEAVQRFIARAKQFKRDDERRDDPEMFQNDRLDNLL
jgi:cell division GTPase FtsZ